MQLASSCPDLCCDAAQAQTEVPVGFNYGLFAKPGFGPQKTIQILAFPQQMLVFIAFGLALAFTPLLSQAGY